MRDWIVVPPGSGGGGKGGSNHLLGNDVSWPQCGGALPEGQAFAIVGHVGAESNLYYLQNWIPGARTARSAKSNCSAAPLTVGGTVTVTQFVSKGFDYDYSCI